MSSIAAPPSHRPEEVDPPRDWDDWGPQEQAETLRRKIGHNLFDWLEEMENEP